MKTINAMKSLVIPIVILTLAGCASAISPELRSRADSTVTISGVLESPEAHKGKTVLWGGVIAGLRNTTEGTKIEIVKKSLAYNGRPEDSDRSEGRFLAIYDKYLDAIIYSKGREVTIGGTLTGVTQQRLDEIQYRYPLITAKEIVLWPKQTEKEVIYYPPWYGPGFYHYRHDLRHW